MKDVDLGEPTPFLDHVYLGCTERECQISEDIVDNYKNLFESRISAGAMTKYQKRKPQGNLMPKRYLRGPVTWKVTWKDIANWRIQRLTDYTKSQRHAWIDHQSKRRNWITWRIVHSLPTNCCKMSVLGSYWKSRCSVVCEQTCLCGHRIDKSL